MKLPRRFVLYVVAVNLVAGLVVIPFLHQRPLWLVAAEALLLLSLLVGLRLQRGLFRTLEVIGDGAQFLRESDFTSRLRPSGQPELDTLVLVYNQMVDHLREERTRLLEQHHFLAQILERSPSAVLVLDFDGAIELLNPAAERLLGLPAADARGRKLQALPSPVIPVLETLEPGQTRVLSLPDGRRLRCRRGSFQDRGFARGYFTIEELTEELRQVEKAAYEKLIRMMSHEVNNSVGASNSLLHSCLTYVPLLPPEHGRDLEAALKVVITRTEQLSGLMRGFAEVVRLPPPRLAPCDLQQLLGDIEVLMRPECLRRRVTWRWDLQQPAPVLPLDRAQMVQVFVNLVKNALEAIGTDGTITVRIGRRGDRPSVVIEDSGPGLSAEARAQLFTPFFTSKDNGQGIGLTLVQQILGQHHLDYALESPPGGPTQFAIRF